MNVEGWLLRGALVVIGLWLIARRARNVLRRRERMRRLGTIGERERRVHRLELLVVYGFAGLLLFLVLAVIAGTLGAATGVVLGFVICGVASAVGAALAELVLTLMPSQSE